MSRLPGVPVEGLFHQAAPRDRRVPVLHRDQRRFINGDSLLGLELNT